MTGPMSVKIGDTWIQEKPELMVLRDFIADARFGLT